MLWAKKMQIENLRRQLQKSGAENRRLIRDLHNLRVMMDAERTRNRGEIWSIPTQGRRP